MKIRHLLLGLMICVAGTGAIDLSGGFLDDQNTTRPTPFLIFGHVLYEGGAPCNSPNVSIANLDTGAAWYADTIPDSNFYQTLLRVVDVSAGDVLRWRATDGAVVNTTNHTVGQGDLESGGIFDFNMILQSIAPGIIGYSPESQINDTGDATRRFNITIDQVVDVTWLINSSPAQTNESVTDAAYTHTNVAIGVWNISARASNENGTAMQEWVWDIIVSATASQPAAPFMVCGWVNYEGGGVCEEHAVNITNLNTGTGWQAETRSGYSYYELIPDSADVGTGDVLEFNVTDGVGYNKTMHTVTQGNLESGGIFDLNLTLPVLAPLVDVQLTPDDDQTTPGVQVINPDCLATNRTVTITANVTDPDCYGNITSVIADITGADTVGDSPVSLTFISNSSATTARYTGRFNMSDHSFGDYAVVVKATNVEGFTDTSSKSFTYLYEAPAFIPLSPFIIYGSVSYDNGTPCDSPFVVVTNLNTSKELIADNQTGESFYQLVTSSAFAKAGDVLRIDASKNGSPVGNATHTVNQTDIEQGAIEANINEADMPDFMVTEISFNPSEPLIGDLVTINATIVNSGAADGEAFVEFYDNKSITITSDDTITLPDSLRIRVHFMAFCVHSDGNITIHNETQLVEELPITESGGNYWTEWCDGETIRIESLNAWFIVDRYEAVLANESITLGAGNSTNIPVVWNLSDQYMGWVTNGTHNITVRVDPYNQVIESNATNNERTEAIDVNPSLDFAVTNITFSNDEPVLGDLVEIDATIHNYGVGSGTAVVKFFYDNISTENNIPIANETVTLNGIESKVISASWRTGAAYGGVGDHNITVIVDLHNHLVDANETNNTLRKQLFVNGTDLTVTAIEIPCGDDHGNPCYVGQDVNVTATIANIGAADATNFTVEFRNGTCSDDSSADTGGANFSKVHIDRLNSGESRNVSVIWNPAEPSNRMITASIPYNESTDNNENNEWFECAWVKERYDFTVESVDVEPQRGVRRGESVNITATIGSIGYGGGNVSIGFFVNSTDFAGTGGERFIRIGTIDDVYVEVGETETVSMTWGVDVAGGCHLIAAVVNPDNKVEESEGIVPLGDGILFRGETRNNVKNCTLQVNPLNLDITDIMLVPAEPNICDIVDVSAKIRNNGGAEANSTVWFYMETGESISGQSWSCKDGVNPWSRSLSLQPEVPIRFHFDYIKIKKGGEVNASVTDRQGQDCPVHFYVKCEECGGQDAKTSKIEFFEETKETDCYYMDGDYRRWDDVWTDWINGTTLEINALAERFSSDPYGFVSLSIDKYQVLLGNETVTLSAGESVYNSIWNASPPLKAGEYYRLMANVEDQKRYSNETYLGGTDLAITNLSVKPVVYDGDRVWVNVTIENLGRMDATDFLVNFTEVYRPEEGGWDPWRRRNATDNLELINTTHVKGLDVRNSINISVSWNASIREIRCEGECERRRWEFCDWTEIADDYRIRVTINPLDSTEKEEDYANNTEEPPVHVDESRDFEVTKLSFYVDDRSRNSSELVICDDVTLNATLNITNFANQGGNVNVSFYIDEVCDAYEIGNTTVAFPAGNGTGYAEIEWKVDSFDGVDITGCHNITVVVDPDNRIYEIDGDQNNTYIQPIYVMASDLVLESLEFHPESPEKGETVSINITIANCGDANASNVILKIYDWAERHIEDVSEQSGIGREQIEITRDDATAMRLYLDLEIDGGRVCINDGSGREIICYDRNFHGWTPWVLDNSTTVVVNETDSAYAKVSKVYYLASSSVVDTSTHDLGINETKKITVNWNPSGVGERLIAAIVDPEDHIIEYDEINNRLAEFIQVQTADLIVSNLSLAWHNGTEIGENEIVKDGDDVRISANIANIGVEDAGSFDVRLLVDDLLIKNERRGGLTPDESISVSADWSAIVGGHVLKVEADYRNEIDETNETNNIMALERYICGANLSGNTSWVTSGLLGEILFGPDQPYDEDEVDITARITNSGYLDAIDFNATLFFDYTPDDEFQKICNHKWDGGKWINRTYHGAEYLYLKVTTPVDVSGSCKGISCRHIIKDDVRIYDGDGNEVARPVAEPEKPCWVRVNGNTTNVFITPQGYDFGPEFDIYFYPIYQNGTSMLFEGIDVPVNSSCNLLMKRNVSAGDYMIMLIIDPGNKVPEDEDYRKDNTISRIMHVKPTRDFTVTNVTGERTNLSDLNTTNITASVSNIGLRNGTAGVSFVDYEEEYRTYKYHFDNNRSLSYLPIPPDARLLNMSGYDNPMIIHRPGVDAIELHFNRITLYSVSSSHPAGIMLICDETGASVWSVKGWSDPRHPTKIFYDKNIPVSGTTAYIYTYRSDFDLDKYTTEMEFHREEVRLNATKEWNESKNITSMWAAYTGDHNITVTLDGDDKITEINESNNESSSLFHVNASRDLVIVGLNITPERPEEGEDVDITAVIANNGSKNASFTVDLWANLTRNKPGADESLPVANLTTDLGGDRVRYITLLKHENLTLAPGKNTTVNATWNDITVAGSPKYHIIAIVDPTDEIDETNESNNEIVKEITPDYPDLTIGKAHVHGGTGKVVVPIWNIGASGASDVTVRFEAYETEECTESVHGWDKCCISHLGASNMQVHFDNLDSRDGYVIVNDRYSIKNPKKKYPKGTTFSGVWSPWVEGDTVWIISMGGTTHAEIDKYRWGNVSDTTIDYLPAGGSKSVDMPWPYEYPRMINMTVDPDNNITEINEGNNEKSGLEYADLRAEGIEFVSPQDNMLSLDAEKFEIEGTITNRGDEDGIIRSVSDFNVTLEFREWYPNGTIGDAVLNIPPKHVEEPLYANEERTITFEFDPSEEFEIDGKYRNYSVFLIADSSGDICESSELYPDGEDNNDTRYVDRNGNEYVRVYAESGYTGGGELDNVGQGEVHGRVVYTIGDSSYGGLTPPGGEETVRYTEVVPGDADIEFARIFLYWFMYHRDPNRPGYCFISEIADVDVRFNGHSLDMAGKYNDTPGVGADYGYGLYSYDVKDHITRGENVATVTNNAEWDMGVHAIGLLVVYEDEDEPLTKYWVNEGADIVMAANGVYKGGLSDGDCITTALFDGVERDDTENVNAAMLTVMGMYSPYSPEYLFSNPGDALEFNYKSIGSRIGTGYWEHQIPARVALTSNEWEDVTDHLKSGANHADIHSFGNYMMPANAFLRLIFPPDLAITNLTAPKSTVVGAHHSINTTIRNDGRSDAHDFNVTFYIDRKQMIRIPHLDLPAGENMTIHLYNWTPMLLLHSYNLTVAADVLSGEDWTEIETKNNAMTKHVTIEEGGFGNETGPRGTGGGSNPTGGEFTESITGRVMDWMTFSTFGGGGGAGMFSALEWIMKGAVWFVLVLFVGLGYWMEQRSYGKVSAGIAGGL